MGALWQDVKFGVRMLRKNPGFTATAVTTLALAIGANTAVFSILNPLLLRKLPVQNPEQLVLVHAAGSPASENISEFFAYDIYSKSRVFFGVMAYNPMGICSVIQAAVQDRTALLLARFAPPLQRVWRLFSAHAVLP